MSNTPDPTVIEWVKASYSGGDGGQCVECTPGTAVSGSVHVRDSKATDGPVLTVSVGAFNRLVEFAKQAGV
ncbi:DUF397 domain-containing protein [Streptomyces sp. NPDC055897]